MGNANTPSRGGKIYISGDGYVKLTDTFGRIYTGREDGQVEIIENGTLEINGNFVAPTANWINGGADYAIARMYDAINDKTYYTAKPASYVGIENGDRQVLKSGEETADTLNLLRTGSVNEASTFVWQYRAAGEETYTTFADGDSAMYAPLFTTPGTFFVSCLVDGVKTENEVEFFVVSSSISFAPAEFPIQFLRLGETGTTMTAEFTTAPTSLEWKYSLTPGGPYMSFDPTATDASFQPMFNDEAVNHYVVVEAAIEGVTHTSVELLYTVEGISTTSKSLTWSGLVSEVGTDPANWSPVANPFKNSLAIGVLDTIDGVPPTYPVYEPVGNDTIYTFWVGPGAHLTINTEDTVNIRGAWQQVQGPIDVTSGVITNAAYFRMDGEAGFLTLSGESEFYVETLLMSDNKGHGGNIKVMDNAIMHCQNLPGRVAADTLESVTYIEGNGRVIYNGDQRPAIKTWIDTYKIVCSEEGFEPIALYDNVNDVTILKARDTNAFSIADDSRTFTTAGNAISAPITLTNIEGVTGFEWKYATNVIGPWMSFDPASSEPSFTPSFDAPGDYYVVAVTSEDVVTSNMKLVTVVDLSVTPDSYQEIDKNVKGDTLFVDVVLGADLTLLTGEWFVYNYEYEAEEATDVTDTLFVPLFFDDGKYDVYFLADVQDADGNSYELISNVVKFYINVDPDKASEVIEGNFELYPNPAKEAFYVNEESTNYNVSLIDAQGRVVLKKAFDNAYGAQRVEFNQAGMYVVKVATDAVVKTKRIVIE